MGQHWLLRGLWIFLGGVGFYLLTGDGSESLLLMVIIALLEFRYSAEVHPRTLR